MKILQNIKEKANIFIKNIKILVKIVNQTKEWHFLKTWQTLQKRGMGSKNVAFATETLLCGNPSPDPDRSGLLMIFADPGLLGPDPDPMVRTRVRTFGLGSGPIKIMTQKFKENRKK